MSGDPIDSGRKRSAHAESDLARSALALFFLLLLGTAIACGPHPAEEDEMNLELSLSLNQESVLMGESIGMMLVLKNRADEPIEIPSIVGNDQIVGFLLRDDSGKELGRYDYRDFQRMVGTSRLREDRFELHEFAPGASEQVYRDLMRFRNPLSPGRYELVALYQWEDISLRTEPQPLMITPSHPGIMTVGWDSDFGGPHHLLFAWQDVEGEQGLLMDACTFGATHRGLDHTSRVAEVKQVEQLQLSRDLGDVAEMQGTLVWKERGRLRWRSLDPGVDFPVHEAGVELTDWLILPAVYRESATTTVALLTNGTGTEVLALALHNDGQVSEIDRRVVPVAQHRLFVHSTDDGPLLIQATNDDSGGTRIEAVGLGRSGKTQLLWNSERPVHDLTALIGETGHTLVAASVLSEEDKRIYTRIWRGPKWQEESGPEFALPDAHEIDLELGAAGTLHALARGPGGSLLYSNDGEPFEEVQIPEMDLERSMLVVGRSAVGFLLGPGKEGGVILEALDAPALSGVLERAKDDDEIEDEDDED